MATIAELSASLNFKVDTSGVRRLTTAVAAATTAVTAYVGATLKAVDANAKLAGRLGVSAQELESLEFAAGQAGVASGVVAKSLQELSKRSAEAARGQGSAQEAFARLGIELRNQNGQLRQSPVLFRELAGRLQGLGRSEQIELADKIFGGEGVQVLQLLDQGAAGIAELQKEFVDLGGAASDADNALAARFTDNLGRLSVVSRGVGLIFARILGPAIETATNSFLELFKANRELIELRLGERFQVWSNALSSVIARAQQFFNSLSDVQQTILKFTAVLIGLGIALAVPFLGPIIAAGLFAAVLDDLITFINNDGVSALDLLLAKSETLQTVFAAVASIGQAAVQAFTAFGVALGGVGAGIAALSEGNFSGLGQIFDDVTDQVSGILTGNVGLTAGATGQGIGSSNTVNNDVKIEIVTDNPAAAGQAVSNNLQALQNNLARR